MSTIARLCGVGLLLGLLATVLLKNMLADELTVDHRQRALLIGLDGVQYEQLEQVIGAGQAPNIGRFQPKMAYTGGITGTTTEQPTLSGPGWTTVLTGTWADRHRIISNDSGMRTKADSLFKLISHSSPTRHSASIVGWNPINDNFAEDVLTGDIELAIKCGGDDQCVVDRTTRELEAGNLDFIFVQLDQPDTVGHENGFGPSYQTAIAEVDHKVGQILEALEERKQSRPEENWLVILTTDHGRQAPDGYHHGGQSRSEKTAFIGLNQSANKVLTQPDSAPVDQGMDGLYGFASLTDIAPTVLAHMRIALDPQRPQMQGVSLIDPVDRPQRP